MSAAFHGRLILNGKCASEDAVREAVSALRARGATVSVRLTWEHGDMDRYVEEAITDGVGVIVAGGGDGTLNEAVGALARRSEPAEALPSLGLLPLGTANDFAVAAAIPKAPLAALELVATSSATPIDLLRLTADGVARWGANLASGGFGTQVTVETPEGMKKLLGGLAYLLTGLAKLGRIEPLQLAAHGPDFSWSGPCIALGLGNGRQAGGGQVLCPEATIDDGLLDLTILPELSGEVASTLGMILTEGKESALERVAVRARLPWVELRAPSPMVLNLDGEPVEAEHFRLECVADRIRMHLPPTCPLTTRLRSEA